MKIIDTDFLSHSTGQRDMYDFDKLSTLDDLKVIINKMLENNFEIDKIVVREFDDYENGPLVMRYDLANIDNITKDFDEKTIETYDLIGKYNNSEFIASMIPRVNRLIINYKNEHKDEIDKMMQELDEQEKKTNEEQLTNNSNIFRL